MNAYIYMIMMIMMIMNMHIYVYVNETFTHLHIPFGFKYIFIIASIDDFYYVTYLFKATIVINNLEWLFTYKFVKDNKTTTMTQINSISSTFSK